MSNQMTHRARTRIAVAACGALILTGIILGLAWLSIYMAK
jgi:hypothetical protein